MSILAEKWCFPPIPQRRIKCFEYYIFFSILIVNLLHFMAKYFRHATKAQKGLLTNGVPSGLCAFVATFPARPV